MRKESNLSARLFSIYVALLVAAVILGASGCAINRPAGGVHQYLDQTTGITVTGLREPVIFFREEPAVAANARDYLYVGPVEMNRMGKRAYYLWFGEWSSIDRVLSGQSKDAGLEEIIILLDGAPMELNNTLAPNDKSRIIQPPYSVPVANSRNVYMRVSGDQLNAIAAAENIVIRLGNENSFGAYRLWSGDIDSFGSITKSAATESRQWVGMID